MRDGRTKLRYRNFKVIRPKLGQFACHSPQRVAARISRWGSPKFLRTEQFEYLKFSPLPSKPPLRSSLYTGPPKWPTTDTFYKNFGENTAAAKLAPIASISGIVSPQSVNAGDVVELLNRDGSVQGFGMVTFAMDDNSFDFIPIEGELRQGHAYDVSMAFRGYFPALPAKKYEVSRIQQRLKTLVQNANKRLLNILPLGSVVHSQHANETYPRSLDFDYICRCIDKLQKRGFRNHTKPRNLWSAEGADRLAVYFSLAYHSLKYVRTQKSQFVLVSSKTMDAINKVMHALTRTELEHGAAELMQNQKLPNEESVAGKLLCFLEHWVLWNDARLIRAVEAVLEQCIGKSRTLDSPRALSSALYHMKKIDMFPWMGNRPSPASSSYFTNEHEQKGNDELEAQPIEPLKAKTQHSHLFTPNLTQGSVYLSKFMAASFDSDNFLLNVFIPRIPRIPSILSANSSNTISIKARSVFVKNCVFSLLPLDQANKYSFKPGTESPAIRLQVRLNRRTLAWDERSVAIACLETVPIATEDMSKLRGLYRALSSVEPLISDHELQLPDESEATEDPVAVAAAAPNEMTAKNVPDEVPLSLMSLHAQAAAGRIAGLYMKLRQIEAPFLVTSHGHEVLSTEPKLHERLGVDAYVPIGRPFDSGLALLAQEKLLGKKLPTLLYSGEPRSSLVVKAQEALLPGLDLMSVFEERDFYFQNLRRLQEELQDSPTFHIFRCVLLQSSSPQDHKEGQLVRAFCKDLNIDVDVFLPAHSDQVFNGDQVICTEILELDPLFGLFVVSL